MEKLENTDKKGISTKRKIGKTTYEVVVHFNENYDIIKNGSQTVKILLM